MRDDHWLAPLRPRGRASIFALIALSMAGPLAAGSVVLGNFNRSPAFPNTPNGRAPQEVAQVIEFKQRQVLQDQGMTLEAAKPIAARGVAYSAAAFVGLGSDNYTIAQRLGWVAAAGGAAGGVMCLTGLGCSIGMPLMAVSAVAGLGAQSICMVADCSIQVGGDGNIEGEDVRVVEATETPVAQTEYPFVNTAFWGDGVYDPHYTQFGVLKEFIVYGDSKYRRAFIMPYTPAGSGYPSNWVRDPIGQFMPLTSQTGIEISSRSHRCENLSTPTAASPCPNSFRWQNAGTAKNCYAAGTGNTMCYLMYSTTYASVATGLPTYTYQPVQQLILPALGTGSALPPETAAKPVHPKLVEAVANDIWRRQGASAPVPYSEAAKVTEADVNAYRQAYPDRAASLGDWARPANAPGQPVKVGPIDDPVTPPQQVEVVNPVTQTAASSNPGESDNDDPDQELDNSDGLLGDPFQAVRDFMVGPFATFMSPSIELPEGIQCPVITIDLPQLLGHEMSRAQSSEFMCTWFNEQRPLIIGVLHLFYAFGALIIVFRNS